MPTPDDALKHLQEGNSRFVEGNNTFPRFDISRREETTTNGQKPFATVVTCSDSRIPVEVLFDQGIGDIFVVRVPGNVCNTDEIGAIEYGAAHLGTPLCLVLGHTYCGAVTDVTNKAHVEPCVAELVGNIQHAVDKTKDEHPELDGQDFINEAIVNNVWQSIADLYKRSDATKELVKAGKLKVMGAVYDVHSGKIDWLGQHPQESEIM